MNLLHKEIEKKISYFLNEGIPLENKNFDLAMFYCIPATLVMAVIFFVYRLDKRIAFFSLMLALFMLVMTFVAEYNKEYKLYTAVFCLVVNFVVYPVFFILTGNIHHGVPLYMAAGIILSFFLLAGKLMLIIVALEIVFDSMLVIYAYFYRDYIEIYKDQIHIGEGIAVSFVIASFVPIFIIVYQTIIFKKISSKASQSNYVISNAEVSKSRFLANMTHEIRTPMNAIVGMNELILKEELSPAAREQAETIKEASSQLLTIINNILVYSKLDSNKMELLQTQYSFKKLISEIIHTVSVEYAAEETEFEVFIDRNIPRGLYGDDIRIKQVFMYLLFSSVHQLPHGRMSLDVSSEKNPADHTVKLKCRVAETGRGLSEGELDAVFGAYTRYDSRQKSNYKGMGLELSICKEILNMMGGSLKIESVIGIGMAVVFEFSNYIIDEKPIVTIPEKTECQVLIYLDGKNEEKIWKPLMEDFKINPIYVSGPSAFRAAIENKRYTQIFIPDAVYAVLRDTLISAQCEEYTYVVTDYQHVYQDYGRSRIIRRPLSCLNLAEAVTGTWLKEDYQKSMEREKIIFPEAKILVVDDSMVNLKVMLSLLDNFQIRADMASSGEECLRMLDTERYDLLLLDQRMPEMDGIETLHKVRSLSLKNKDIPALCITADFGAEIKERLMEEGFQDYVAKPVKIYHLQRMLRKYLPEELAVNIEPEESGKEQEKKQFAVESQPDPLVLDTERGCENIGGNKEAYVAILNTYYQEGTTKMEEIPIMSVNEDLSLYITNVHSLKSSSGSVGAVGISALFKELEAAGKEGNRQFIDEHTKAVLSQFSILLENVKSYLVENNAFEGTENETGEKDLREQETLELSVIEELKQMLANVNLKHCEEILDMLGRSNYGDEYNKRIMEIRKNYDMFEYHKVKGLIDELLAIMKA